MADSASQLAEDGDELLQVEVPLAESLPRVLVVRRFAMEDHQAIGHVGRRPVKRPDKVENVLVRELGQPLELSGKVACDVLLIALYAAHVDKCDHFQLSAQLLVGHFLDADVAVLPFAV